MSNHIVRVQTHGSSTGEKWQKKGKKEATKSDAKRKANDISTSRRVSLRQKVLCETNNSGLGGGEDSGKYGEETRQRRRVGEGCGKDRRRAVACAVMILCEDKGMFIGGIEVGRYGNLNCDALARVLVLHGSLTAFNHQM